MCLFTENNSMGSSLILAVRNGDVNAARQIITSTHCGDLDLQGPRKDGSALFLACSKGFVELAHMLILRGADMEAVTSYGATPLHAAVDHNQVETTRLLLNYGANVNARTIRGDTPCHYAAYRGHAPLVQLLAEAGADVTVVNSKSQCPIILADSRDHHTIAKYLRAVTDLAKQRSPTAGTSEQKLSGYQKTISSQFMDNVHCGTNQSIRSDFGVSSQHSSNDFSCHCMDSLHSPLSSSPSDVATSNVSLRNLCGAELTKVLKEKQYAKKMSWQD